MVKTSSSHSNTIEKNIATETVNLYRELGINKLTFLCDFNSNWITKNSKDRTDYKQLTKAVEYLRDNKVGQKFNGSITVDIAHLRKFLEHLYILTKCDASFSHYHFIDDNEDLIGYIQLWRRSKIWNIKQASKWKIFKSNIRRQILRTQGEKTQAEYKKEKENIFVRPGSG